MGLNEAIHQVPVSGKCKNVFISIYLNRISPNVKGCIFAFTQIKKCEGFERWEHFQRLCCSIGLQWPNPRNKESLWFSHCLLEEMGKTCQLPEHDILPVIPLFFFSGVTLAHRAAATCLFHCARNGEGGGLRWSQIAANRLYNHCSVSGWSIQRKNDRGDNPQSSPSGPTDWKLLGCLIIQKSGVCVGSPVLVLWSCLTNS